MDDDDPIRLVPRGDLDRVLDPTEVELLHSLNREIGRISDQVALLQRDVAALMRPDVEAIHPQNPWARIAEARQNLAVMREAGDLDDVTFREAMANLAASERQLDDAMSGADGIVADLDSRRRRSE